MDNRLSFVIVTVQLKETLRVYEKYMCVLRPSMTGAVYGEKEISLNPFIVPLVSYISLELPLHANELT